MRAIDCPCGHYFEAADDEELFRLCREHVDADHPETIDAASRSQTDAAGFAAHFQRLLGGVSATRLFRGVDAQIRGPAARWA